MSVISMPLKIVIPLMILKEVLKMCIFLNGELENKSSSVK